MQQNNRKTGRRRLFLASAVAAATCMRQTASLRADSTWQVNSGNWSVASNWNGGVPGNGVNAYFTNSDNINRVINFDVSSSNLNVLELYNELYNSTDTINQAANTLTASIQNLYGGGIYNNSGGINLVTYYTIVGDDTASAPSVYNLTGNGTLTVSNTGRSLVAEFASASGNGVINQSGQSTNTVGNASMSNGEFGIATNPGSTGVFNLAGAATLTVNGTAYVGGYVSGAGGAGVLNISGGTMTVSGTGAANSAGTPGQLVIYNTSGTAVNLMGGTLSVGSINTSNPARFTWTGGTLSLTASPFMIDPTAGQLGRAVTIASGMSLTDTTSISVNTGATFAVTGTGGFSTPVFNIAGGTASLPSLTLAGTGVNASTVNLTAGSLNVSGNVTVNTGGTFNNYTGTGSVTAQAISISSGTLNIAGGGISASTLSIAGTGGNTGTVNLTGTGSLITTGNLAVNTGGQFNLSGGSLSVGLLNTSGNPSRFQLDQWNAGHHWPRRAGNRQHRQPAAGIGTYCK